MTPTLCLVFLLIPCAFTQNCVTKSCYSSTTTWRANSTVTGYTYSYSQANCYSTTYVNDYIFTATLTTNYQLCISFLDSTNNCIDNVCSSGNSPVNLTYTGTTNILTQVYQRSANYWTTPSYTLSNVYMPKPPDEPNGLVPCSAEALYLDDKIYASTLGLPPTGVHCTANVYSGAWWGYLSAPAGTILEISTQHSYTNFATVIYLYTGTCTDLQCLDYATPTSSQTTGATLNWSSNGELVYLVVAGQNTQAGEFELTVSATTKTTTSCNSPIKVHLREYEDSLVVPGYTSFGSTYTSSCAGSANTVWYEFIPPTTYSVQVEISSCSENNNTLVTAYSGQCSNLGCVEPPSCENTLYLAANQTALVTVTQLHESMIGIYNLHVQVKPILPTTCNRPDVITLQSHQSTSTEVATGGQYNLQSDPCGKAVGPAYWIQLNVPLQSNVTVTTCSSYTSFDTFLVVYSGSCSALHCVAFNDDAPCTYNSGLSTVNFIATYSSYFVVITGYYGQSGNVDVTFSAN